MKQTSSKIFSGLAQSYDAALDIATLYQDRHWKRWAVQRMGIQEGDLVLDIGCGTLRLEEGLAGWKCRFVGLDLAPEMVRRGMGKRIPGVALLVNSDAESLPFPDGSFDSVVSCYVPKYVDIGRFTDELARVSKPGAMVLLYDFARPRGPVSPLLELYIQGGLRVVGLALSLAKREEAFTFSNLPWIIEQTTWDRDIVGTMEEKGFETIRTARFAGGVVFAYSGRKRGSP
ncbi:MAG: class I SAM-dependent methyltransferase [Thaumarchaeota archaeon]|nr:class I SAM-dependent methyltransferase [Nitrososphaerota archaeon]